MITFDTKIIVPWLKGQGFRVDRLRYPHFIGNMKEGKLVAVTIYDDFNGQNAFSHVVSDGSKRWLNKEFLRTSFRYAFGYMGCKRLTGLVPASNLEAQKFDAKLGYSLEGKLERAAGNGEDLLIYRMFKEDCRWLR